MGLALNFRFVEIFDFFGGLAMADLAGDDGKGNNDWPWQVGEERGNPVPRSDLRW